MTLFSTIHEHCYSEQHCTNRKDCYYDQHFTLLTINTVTMNQHFALLTKTLLFCPTLSCTNRKHCNHDQHFALLTINTVTITSALLY